MLFFQMPDKIHACSRVEGMGRLHGSVFHEALDYLEAKSETYASKER
jgi:hypothetical protein